MSDSPLVFPRAMSQRDASLWRLQSDPAMRSTMVAVAIFDSSPDPKRLDEAIAHSIRRLPRLRQKVVAPPIALSTPVWTDVDTVDLDFHLQEMTLPRGGSLREVLGLAANMTVEPFDLERPLWEFLLVDGMEGGRSALIQKLHHAMTDGLGGVMFMKEFYSFHPNERKTESGRVESEPLDPETLGFTGAALLERLGTVAASALGVAQEVVRDLANPLQAALGVTEILRSVARTAEIGDGPLSPAMRGRSGACSYEAFTVPLEALRGAGKAAGGSLNDAFLAGVTGGFRLYHEAAGVPAEALRMGMPINVRAANAPANAGNEIAIARVSVPISEVDPIRRMRATHELIERVRNEPAVANLEALSGLLNLVPTPLSSPLLASIAKQSDFVATSLPGPNVPLYLAGAQVVHFFGFGPPAGAAANITQFGYRDQAEVGIHTDPAAVPESEVLCACMEQGFDEVLSLA